MTTCMSFSKSLMRGMQDADLKIKSGTHNANQIRIKSKEAHHFWFLEDLTVNHVPGPLSQGQHPKEQ